MLKTIIVFGCTYLVLVLTRCLFLKIYKKRIACKADENQSVYNCNQIIIKTESIYLLVLAGNLVLNYILMDRWAIDVIEFKGGGVIFRTLYFFITIVTAFFSSSIIWRDRSYFRFNKQYLEYNLSLENRTKDTIKVLKDEIESVITNTDKIIIILKDKKKYIIPEKWLALFNGSGIVKSKLLSFAKPE